MIKDIRYNGLTETPSDYECPDGDLATSIQLINEDGALHPILPPKTMFMLDDGNVPVFLHKGNGYKHYIVRNGLAYTWYNENEQGVVDTGHAVSLYTFDIGTDVHEVNAIGNTLLVLTSEGTHYFLWKDGAYKHLGTHLPELPISFGLKGKMEISDVFEINFYDEYLTKIVEELKEENKTLISNQVLGKVNKFIADESVNKGKFMFPFFVRYAYRLYDQTLTMHSAPVLMVCTSGLMPQLMVRPDTLSGGDGEANAAALYIAAMFHQLEYTITDSAAVGAINDWKDIIESVDIFISKPIYTYDQNGKCQRFANSLATDIYSICKDATAVDSLDYQKNVFSDLYAAHQSDYDPTYQWRLLLPQREEEDVINDIKNESLFYFLKSIEMGELATGGPVAIEVSKEYLQSLTNREVMTDDYDSHDALAAQYSYVYNSRLNLSGIKKTLFGGFNPDSLFCKTTGDVFSRVTVNVYYYINQDGNEIVTSGGQGTYRSNTPYLYLYHPNKNAYKAVVQVGSMKYEVRLKHHQMLNGAYYFGDWTGVASETIVSAEQNITDKTVDLPNKLYASVVDNPFLFQATGISTVGVGDILGIRSAAKAMSQGQFGQYPLYVFTGEGVFAIDVDKEGKYYPPHPVSRDVVVSPESITQLDTAVVFATARGLMLLSGSDSACLSDDINSEAPFSPINDITVNNEEVADDMLQGLRGVVYSNNVNDVQYLDSATQLSRVRFLDFVQGCRMLYDYTHQRIVCYNTSHNYAYVYSLKSKRWGLAKSKILTHLNSYPESLALLDSDKPFGLMQNATLKDEVVDFCEYADVADVKGVLVSRPLKLDAPDILKTIDTVITRGNFAKGHVKTILYGSRDLTNWMPIWSSVDHYLRGFRGTPYKYFRLVLLTALGKEESIFSSTVQFDQRMIDVLR